jgi:hypothetical protein
MRAVTFTASTWSKRRAGMDVWIPFGIFVACMVQNELEGEILIIRFSFSLL